MSASNPFFQSEDVLREECQQLTRYLINRRPSGDLIQRYIEAHTVLFRGEQTNHDLVILSFVRQHPWSLPYIDAVLAIRQPYSLLRNKILLMTAILETTPHFTEFFFPKPLSIARFFAHMTGQVFLSGTKFVMGSMIYLFSLRMR